MHVRYPLKTPNIRLTGKSERRSLKVTKLSADWSCKLSVWLWGIKSSEGLSPHIGAQVHTSICGA